MASQLLSQLTGANPTVLRDAAGTFVLRCGFVLLELLGALALARCFGAANYGIYAVVMAWVGLLAIPAAMGFDRLLVREVAASCAIGAWGTVRGVLRYGTQRVLASSLLVAAVGALLATQFAPTGAEHAVQLGMLIVPLLAYARIRQAALQGLGRVVLGQLPEMLVLPLMLLTLIGLVASTGLPRSGLLAVSLQLVAACGACVVGIVLLRHSLPNRVRAAVAEFRGADWLRRASPLVVMMAMNVVLTMSDTALIGWLRDAREAGIYRVASQMASFVVFPLTALNMAVAPRIATMFARQDVVGLRDLAALVTKIAVLCALPIAAALVLGGSYLLGMFGDDFVEGRAALMILCAAYVVNAAAGSAGYMLIMTQHEGTAARVFSVAAAVAVCGNLALIPSLGSTGAAIGTAAGLVCVSGGLLLQSRRHLGAIGR